MLNRITEKWPLAGKLLRNDFFWALLFLITYLSTSPYIYGWDDQHLEIPILKHLIDPTLFQGDYYVESATKYFTCWLYPLLAKIITVKQIPATYLILFVFSRYVMFYWVYRLWVCISGSNFTAICTVLAFLLLGRTDEFLYRSFCHEEFTFMFMFAGIYCFYKDRYLLAAILFGLGVNFHAIYSLFPMLYMLVFLLLFHPQRFKITFQTGFAFVLMALPFLCWQIPISISREVAHPVPASDWMPLYMLSCPQNFFFGYTPLQEIYSNIHTWWSSFSPHLFLVGLYIFNIAFNPSLRSDKKLHSIMGLSLILLGIIYYFDYIQPSRFVIDLNIIRVEQYMRFFIMGYTTVWACEQLKNAKPWLALASVILVLACGTDSLIGLFFLSIIAAVYIIHGKLNKPLKLGNIIRGGVLLVVLGVLIYVLTGELKNSSEVAIFWHRYRYVLILMSATFIGLMMKNENKWLRRALIIVPLIGSFCVCVSNCHEYFLLRDNGQGPWALLRDWKDMQLYVRDHTPKDSLILTPYDTPMGGFRINSDRKALVCYRDCGIIGFDYNAAVEWNNRINDIKNFKIYTNERIDQAALIAILKYNVNYIVFMKYYAPPGDNAKLKKIYENEVFSLFKVL